MTKQNNNISIIVSMALAAFESGKFGVDKVYNMLAPVFGDGLNPAVVECVCYAFKGGCKDIDSAVVLLSSYARVSKTEGNMTAENGAVIVSGVNSGNISVNVTLGTDKNETSVVAEPASENKARKSKSMTPEESDRIFNSGEYNHSFFVAISRKQGAKGLAYELDGEVHTVQYEKNFATDKGLSEYLLSVLKDTEGTILTSHIDLVVRDPERFIYACGKTGTKVYKKWSALMDMAKSVEGNIDSERKRSEQGRKRRGSEKPVEDQAENQKVESGQETSEEADQ